MRYLVLWFFLGFSSFGQSSFHYDEDVRDSFNENYKTFNCLGKEIELDFEGQARLELYLGLDRGFGVFNKKNECSDNSKYDGVFTLDKYRDIRFEFDGPYVHVRTEKSPYEPQLSQTQVLLDEDGEYVKDDAGEYVRINELRELYETTFSDDWASFKFMFETKWKVVVRSPEFPWDQYSGPKEGSYKMNPDGWFPPMVWVEGEAPPTKEEEERLAWASFLYYLKYDRNPLGSGILQAGDFLYKFYHSESRQKSVKVRLDRLACVETYANDFAFEFRGNDSKNEEKK